jgi:hypothetical protein
MEELDGMQQQPAEQRMEELDGMQEPAAKLNRVKNRMSW